MTLYPGTRSLDAEIILNFIEGTVTMDYTLNKFGNPHGSNSSVVLKSEWRNANILIKIAYFFQAFLVLSYMGIIGPIVMVIMTELIEHRIIRSANSHYNHQCLLRWTIEKGIGTAEQACNGAIKDTLLKFQIYKNLWWSYELSGEYKDKIKSISFLRNITTTYKFGKFREEKQNGWNIIFEFTDPPQNGSAKIIYV